MNKKFTFLKVVSVLLMGMFLSFSGFAQVTTSSLTGLVQEPSGEASIGATVVAKHLPSGSVYSAMTNASGRFNLANMRVGGPYHVEISFVGYKTEVFDDIYLQLGQPFVINVKFVEEGSLLDELVVSSTRNNLLNNERTGSVTTIGRNQINTLPSISRNINDFTRLTPQANGTSIGGGNYRQNNITVDGADFNNNFGIGTNLPGGSTTPISLDALEEISVNITPYDVRQSGFIGSAVNAVTRSGNNNVSGSVYTYFRNQNHSGNKIGSETLTRSDLDYKQYGFRLGGPIIKDKLFYFLNAEIERETTPGPNQRAATDSEPFGSSPQISRPTASEMDAISKYLADTYGYITGPYQGYSSNSFSNKFLARLDWNINRNHKLNVRYSWLESESSRINASTSTSPFSPAPYSGNRQNNTALQFENSGYFQAANFKSFAAELNSSFGSVFNTLRVSQTNQNDPRSTKGGTFPFVDILKDGSVFTSFGTELFSAGNLRDVKSWSIVDNLNFAINKHNFTVGTQLDFYETKNGFQRFATGYYVFQSWNDFVNGGLPSHYGLTYPLTDGFKQVFPSFKFAQYALYFQDDIKFSSRFNVTAGLRLDMATYPGTQEDHPLISQLTFAEGQKVNTGRLPDPKVIFSPRVGFNYDIKGDRSVQLRGGSGLFTGRVPFVWIVSQIGDAGMLQVTQTLSGANVPGPFRLDPYYPSSVPQAGTTIPTGTTIIDPNFKMPQTWKSNIALDAKLPWGLVGTIEAIFNQDINTAYFRNINLAEPQPLNVAGYPDNRLIYPAATAQKYLNALTPQGQASPTGTVAYNVTQLGNSNNGYYTSLNLKLEKQFVNGFSAMAAYVYSNAKNLFDGSGDQPFSAWQSTPTVNGSNSPVLSHSGFVPPHRIIGALSFRKEYIRHLATNISLVFEGAAQGRFSYIHSNDFNRDNSGNFADLIYVPKDASEITFVPLTVGSGASAVTYTPQQQSDAFFAFIEQDKYLSTRKGQYAERNGAILPWRNNLDLKFLQDIFTNIGGKRNTLQFSLDVLNLGNLINNEWGVYKTTTILNNQILEVTNAAALTPGGTTVPTFRFRTDQVTGKLPTESFRTSYSFSSTYRLQFGLRYIFN